MSKDKKEGPRFSSIFNSLASICLCASGEGDEKKTTKAGPPNGPEATMVAAAKHFSSAHKVRLI